MNRHLLFAAALAASAVTVLFSPMPGGIRPASGCSGGGSVPCSAPGWSAASWATGPLGVPTNGAVRVRLLADYTCGAGTGGTGGASGAPVTITVVDDKGAPVAGTADDETAPPVKTLAAPGGRVVTWRPTGPLAPSTTYTLHVAGLAAGKSTDLSFTTGAGPFAPPKPVLKSPTLLADRSNTSGPTICCYEKGAGGCFSSSSKSTCTGQQIAPRPRFDAAIDVDEPVAAAKVFFKAELELSIAGAPFSTQLDSSVTLPWTSGQVCARVRGTNTLTGETALSPEWCASIDTLDLTTKQNCAAMADVLSSCGVTPGSNGSGGTGSGTLSPAKAEALQLYADVCGTGSNAGPAAAPANDDGGSGCTLGRPARSSWSSGLVIAIGLLALGAARTRTRRAL